MAVDVLGNVGAILGPSLDDSVSLWYTLGSCWQCWGHLGVLGPLRGYLGSCLGYVGVILGPLGASSSTYSSNKTKNDFIGMLK